MSLTSSWLSRRLGYGFAYDEELPTVENWLTRAKEEVGTVPVFDPWRLIEKNPKAKKLSEMGLPYTGDAFAKWELKIDDLRYPNDFGLTP